MDAVWDFSLQIPRHAFTLRDAARAGDIWRACQDAAVIGSSMAGWPPARFREEGTSFVVYRETVQHHRETHYGESLQGTTWVSRFRRRTLCTREVRFHANGEAVASATQQWAHVDAERYKPLQASEEAASAFSVVDHEPSVELPPYEAMEGPAQRWQFEMWHTWSDPLGHANHPAYVDWCDEAVSRRMNDRGLDPLLLVPVADQVTFKSAVQPGEKVEIETQLAGLGPRDELVTSHNIVVGDRLSAIATTVRTLLHGDPERLVETWT